MSFPHPRRYQTICSLSNLTGGQWSWRQGVMMRVRQKRERERQAFTEREPAEGFQPCSHVWDDVSLAPEHQFFGKFVSQIASLRSAMALIPDQTLSTAPHADELFFHGHLIPPQMTMITVCGFDSGPLNDLVSIWISWSSPRHRDWGAGEQIPQKSILVALVARHTIAFCARGCIVIAWDSCIQTSQEVWAIEDRSLRHLLMEEGSIIP